MTSSWTISLDNNPSKMNVNKGFRFMDLPRELQDHILHFSPAICRFQPVSENADSPYVQQGVWIRNGKLRNPWAAMLSVSHYFSTLVKELLFNSTNRFILSGNPAANKGWLLKQDPQFLRRITKLDLLLEWEDIEACVGYSQKPDHLNDSLARYLDNERLMTPFRQAWANLASLLPKLFNIPRLHLSIDIAFHNIRLRDSPAPDTDFEGVYGVYAFWCISSSMFWKIRYFMLFVPFELRKTEFSRLASYQIFLPVHRKAEIKFEKLLMGHDYDSVAQHGKIPYAIRDPRLPHGIAEFEWADSYLDTTKEEQDKIYKKTTDMWDTNGYGPMSAIRDETEFTG